MGLFDIFNKPLTVGASPRNLPEKKIATIVPINKSSKGETMLNKKLVVVTWPISNEVLATLRRRFDVKVNTKPENISPQELVTFVKGADAILCLLTNKITAQVLDSAGPQLKIIASMSVGFDHIDLDAAKERNITVTNTPGIVDTAVAEHTIALLLSLVKSTPQADTFVRAGKYKGWNPTLFVGPELAGKTLGIIGLGHIGSSVAQAAKFGFNMNIIYNDLKPNPEFGAKFHAKYYKLDEVLAKSDFVSLHVPLLPSTKHLINKDRLHKMKHTAYLINTARGQIVDEKALVEALQKKYIAGAALDVYENEPVITHALMKLDNVVLTPHTASATREAREAMAAKAATNIITTLSGKPAPDAIKMK